MTEISNKLKSIYQLYCKQILQLSKSGYSKSLENSDLPDDSKNTFYTIQDNLTSHIQELINDYIVCIKKLFAGKPLMQEDDPLPTSVIVQNAQQSFSRSKGFTDITLLNKDTTSIEFHDALNRLLQRKKPTPPIYSSKIATTLNQIQPSETEPTDSYCKQLAIDINKQLAYEYKANCEDITSIDRLTMLKLKNNSEKTSQNLASLLDYTQNTSSVTVAKHLEHQLYSPVMQLINDIRDELKSTNSYNTEIAKKLHILEKDTDILSLATSYFCLNSLIEAANQLSNEANRIISDRNETIIEKIDPKPEPPARGSINDIFASNTNPKITNNPNTDDVNFARYISDLTDWQERQKAYAADDEDLLKKPDKTNIDSDSLPFLID